MKFIAFFCALAASSTTILHAQDKSNDTTARYFIIQASIGNLQEIQIAKLALQKSGNSEIKAFAARMISDHGQAQAQLMQIVKSRGFQIPAEATATPVNDLMLEKLPSKDFDQMYVHMMVPDHRQTVQLFEGYALTGKDPDVNAYAKQNLPKVKEHLATIVVIDNGMK